MTGLAAAITLRRHGLEVYVHETAAQPGGMVRAVRFRGVDCDLGSHRLHPEALAEPILREACGAARIQSRPRHGRIVLGRRHIPYPMTVSGLLRGLGARRAASFCMGALSRPPLRLWERDRCDVHTDAGYERFVISRAGRAAYEHFYRPYAEKVWGIDPRELSQSIAKKRVSSTRPLSHVRRMLTRRDGGTFLYPHGGMGALIQALLRMARKAGVQLKYGVAPDAWSNADADATVYTGHLNHLLPGDPPLSHRGLYLLFLALPVDRVADVDTWYTPESCYWFGRVSEVGNFSPAARRNGETVICVEIPEGRWGRHQDFTARLGALGDQLQHAGILRGRVRILESRQRYLPSVYPMYRRGWLPAWRRTIGGLASARGLHLTGRQGLFLHCNIDHCITMGRVAAERLSDGATPAGWAAEAEQFLDLRVRD